MNFHYTEERNVQIVLELLKAYSIKRVIASPGAVNISVVASMQQDPYFEMVSCVDERSAAYMACGLAEETGEPVVLSCTGATASRNYMPGLTEAFYRKLPVIALTSSRDPNYVGNLQPQVTDRSQHPKDIIVDYALLQTVKDDEDEWDCILKMNRVLNSLRKGPIHINVIRGKGEMKFQVGQIQPVKKIGLTTFNDNFPSIPENSNIAVFVGEHRKWSIKETEALDRFCASNNAVVLCDHTSKYHGKYRVLFSIIGGQIHYQSPANNFDLLIHIGNVSGAYTIFGPVRPKITWRVNPDGAFSDFFRKLDHVFQMSEMEFFEHYTLGEKKGNDSQLTLCQQEINMIKAKMPEFPFSNIYVASKMAHLIPDGSVMYLGILNTLRVWNFFELPVTVDSFSNTGGFGIDGTASTMIGASYANPSRLYFAVLGDLSFFYDMNCIGNHHVGSNIRVMVINNGVGIEFRNYDHEARFMGDEANAFVAAAGHFGNKSSELLCHYAADLGFTYLRAASKEEFEENYKIFVDPSLTDKPIFFEVFTNTEDESEAWRLLCTIIQDEPSIKDKLKESGRKLIGDANYERIKSLVKK